MQRFILKPQFFYSLVYQKAKPTTVIGDKLPIYVTPAPYGLVVIQEWWGLNSSICKTADIMSTYGFKCVVPDLYRGKIAKDTEEAGHLLSGLDWKQALIDIEESARFLKEDLHCKKIGILGFCMGGALSIASITTSKIISAAAPFYGVCDLNTFKLSNANGPILAQFGQNDDMVGFSSVQDAKRLESTALQQGNKNLQVKIWPGVGHAFCNQDRPEVYNQAIAKQALDLAAKFLHENLK
ncbi:unnamed protein product [Paramecium sonneborni]|uniref:Dienelactone hydrolase domain-containing protein n=1 Tax=Paramecium sonneborni TaxID=65129 RepID=A0A8S1QGM4_9CILI|nr:unnamed protein product [Paramecium sonneborni]